MINEKATCRNTLRYILSTLGRLIESVGWGEQTSVIDILKNSTVIGNSLDKRTVIEHKGGGAPPLGEYSHLGCSRDSFLNSHVWCSV